MKSILIIIALTFSLSAFAAPPKKNAKSKFYDFGEQLIDGHISKPTGTYIDKREQARFDRLLDLKKTLLPALYKTSTEKVFK
jgi:hypothetical protein